MRRLLFLLAVATVLVFLVPAFAQDGKPPVNPLTLGKGPEDGSQVPAWIFYWVLGVGTAISSSLVVALKALWSKLNEERDERDIPGLTEDERAWLKEMYEIVIARNAEGVARVYSPGSLLDTLAKVSNLSQKILDQLSGLCDSKEDRRALRAAFETEKAEIRSIYTDEVRLLQDKLSLEQRERREESEKLWERNNETTREVLTVIKDMIVTLENAARVIEQFNEANG